ncbi:hypothetical protein AXF42_Ash007330 [Apostasia shenzhenica]|uniref:Uncharacterized protein n=1 Tax=Apostasia shenzhenica TaxID=1088818 RepID=A0A2I0B9W7_9ASPA|nr:hypothetical protein AXF42_Ash007330 [Apostasia shenzhenica]
MRIGKTRSVLKGQKVVRAREQWTAGLGPGERRGGTGVHVSVAGRGGSLVHAWSTGGLGFQNPEVRQQITSQPFALTPPTAQIPSPDPRPLSFSLCPALSLRSAFVLQLTISFKKLQQNTYHCSLHFRRAIGAESPKWKMEIFRRTELR